MYNMTPYKNYGTYIYEQSSSSLVISDELDPRLRGYLEGDSFIEHIIPELQSALDGDMKELAIVNKREFGIMDDDRIWIKVNKFDPKNPRFNMWIMNDEYIYGDIDFDMLATILHQAADEGGAIGYIGNAIGSIFGAGDMGDAGTDEDTIVAAAAVLQQIANEKSLDAKLYFDKLEEVYSTKYGESLTDMLETEFSGRAEVSALQAYKRDITPSVLRGLNPLAILFDVALTIVTLGGSSAFMAGIRGATAAATVVRVSSKTTKVGIALARGSAAIGAGTGWLSKVTGLSKLFQKMVPSARTAALARAGVKTGEPLTFISTKGAKSVKTLDLATKPGPLLTGAQKATLPSLQQASSQYVVVNGVDKAGRATQKAVLWSGVFKGAAPKTQKAIATAGKLIAPGALAASHVEKGGGESAPEASMVAKGAEAMGWYDTQTADPRAFIQSQKAAAAAGVAELLFDLKKGSGLFGNTTNQEELLMALTILSLDGKGAKEVQTAYKRLDAKDNVYVVLDDELGGDMAMFAKAHWTACTGEGKTYAAGIANIRSRIKPVDKAEATKQ